MHEILPNLFLSNYGDVMDHTGACFVCNCTKNLPMKCENGTRLAVDDDCSSESMDIMFNEFDRIVQQIDDALISGQDVIVHCLGGQQRSPAVICAYLMAKHRFNLEDAVRYIRNCKRDAFFWQVNFKTALERYWDMHRQ